MAWDLRGNMQDEIDRALMTSRLGPKQIAELYPAYPYEPEQADRPGAARSTRTRRSTKADGPTERHVRRDAAAPPARRPPRAPGPPPPAARPQRPPEPALRPLQDPGRPSRRPSAPTATASAPTPGSSPAQHTTTGKPLLANDPHLAPAAALASGTRWACTAAPSGHKCQYDVAGYTFSGMPGVVIGHNQDIAWGMTNLGADVTDLYLEKVNGDGYLYDGKQQALQHPRGDHQGRRRREPRRSPSATTNNGPISPTATTNWRRSARTPPVGNAAPDRGDGYAVALRWTALDAGNSMDAVFELNRAKDWNGFRKAAAHFEVPSQNLIYADTKGNIGYQAPGPDPGPRQGRRPLDPGARLGPEVPLDRLHPAGRRCPTSTTRSAATSSPPTRPSSTDKYPYLLTKDWGYGSRSQRINDLIESKIKDGGKVSTDDMQTVQMDNSSEIAQLLTPYLLKIDIKDKYVREAQKLLEGWDYTQDADSAAAAYFNAVWRNILKLAFGNKLPKELRAKGQCLYVEPADEHRPRRRDRASRPRVRRARRRPGPAGRRRPLVRGRPQASSTTRTTTGGRRRGPRNRPAADNRDELLARAMKDARWELTAKLGKDIDTWSWGRLHQLFLKNQTLGTEGPGFLQCMLNRGPWNARRRRGGGQRHRLERRGRLRGHLGAVDADGRQPRRPRQVPWINLTGASGHAYNAHYTDQTDKWAKGELLPWAFSKTRSTRRARTADPVTVRACGAAAATW